MKPDIVTFWHGRPLPALNRMCLASQVQAGHRVVVYSYAPLTNLPPLVENEDAEQILPHAAMQRLQYRIQPTREHWRPLQFADLFRMRLQRRGLGIWIDTDVYLLRPIDIDPEQPYFAWESRRYLGNAILYLPKAHPIVADYEKIHDVSDLMPDWLDLRLRARTVLWRLRGLDHTPMDLSVLIYGPLALTRLARRHGSITRVTSSKSFYVHSRRFFDACNVADIVGDPDVLGIHVKNKWRSNKPPRAGSLYEWAQRKVEGLY